MTTHDYRLERIPLNSVATNATGWCVCGWVSPTKTDNGYGEPDRVANEIRQLFLEHLRTLEEATA